MKTITDMGIWLYSLEVGPVPINASPFYWTHVLASVSYTHLILVSSCVFFSAVKVIRLVRFQGRQGGFMSSKAQAREKDLSLIHI